MVANIFIISGKGFFPCFWPGIMIAYLRAADQKNTHSRHYPCKKLGKTRTRGVEMALFFSDYTPVDIFISHRAVLFTLQTKVLEFSPGFVFSCSATLYFTRLLQNSCTPPQALQSACKV